MKKVTHADALAAAEREIRAALNGNGCGHALQVCADTCQMLDNVAHMKWFQVAVANEFIHESSRYQHLEDIPYP